MPSHLKSHSSRNHKPTLTTYFMSLFLIHLFFIIPTTYTQSPPTYSGIPNGQKIMIKTDTKDAVLSLRSSTDQSLSFPISYSSTMAPAVTGAVSPKLVVVTSVSSFDCLASTEFSFNMSIISPTLSGFTMQFLIFGNTYLNKFRFNYLAAAWDPAYTDITAVPPVGLADILYSDCFLTSDLAVVSTTKSQTFKKQKLAAIMTDNSNIEIQSFITGLKFFNNRDVSKTVLVKSQILENTDYITQTVQITGNTVIQWICLGTVVIDRTYPDIYQHILPYNIGYFVLDRASASIDMSTFPSGYLIQFDNVDSKFFGLIEIQLVLGKPFQIINFLSQNIGSVQLGYQSLASGGKMGYFFISKRRCTPNTLLYSLNDKKCYTPTCPPKTAQDTPLLICALCHYSCQTCSGLDFNQCDTCQAANKRDPVSAGECKCQSTYTDNGVPLCEKCSNLISFCDTCSSKTVCNTCIVGGFILKPDSSGCECDPVNFPYYVTASNVCSPFPGCLVAQTNPEFEVCTQCDISQNFKETPSTKCDCLDNYELINSLCVDICGDGINPYANSTTYCDDGNADNLDGCDANCAVEDEFGCFNPPNVAKSFCSPVKAFTLKYLYAERIVSQNAGNFFFNVTPSDPQLAAENFTYYVQTSIAHTTAIGTYDPTTSILKIKISYTQTIEDQNHDIHITLDPYVMSVAKQSFNIKSSGVNYDLTVQDNPGINIYLWYMSVSVSGIIVLASLIFTFINYKMAAVELLLSSQLVYVGLLSWMENNLSLYPLTGLRYLAGYNTLQMFQINTYNAKTPFLLSSYTFAEFLLNLNFMAAIVVLIIIIIIPLKINVVIRMIQRKNYSSAEMQQKLVNEQPNSNTLSQMSSKIKTAQMIQNFFIDKIYFGFSLIVFLPIVLYFSIQLGFIGKVGRYELSSFANIMLSIILLMLDFCFFILIFQDTDKKVKTFNFGSKKLKSYPNRLVMLYFLTCCIFTIVLLTDLPFYVLAGMTLVTGIYTFVENPYEKGSLEKIDSVSKPIIALICQIAIKATSFFKNQMIFIPIGVDALLLISAIVTIVRVIKVKTSRAQAAKKMLEDAQNDDDDNGDVEKNDKNTNDSEYNSIKESKKINAKLTKAGLSQDQSGQNGQKDSNTKSNNQNENDDSAGELNKDQSLHQNEEELGEEEDQLTKIKKSLRQDLKKRRGIVQKVGNDDGQVFKTKKQKKNKLRELDFAEDKKNQ